MPYSFRIEYDGTDISSKVRMFTISDEIESYCRELSLEIADESFYDSIDFSILDKDPKLEVFTQTGSTEVSQGKFFVERPVHQTELMQTIFGLWGRSKTALLGEPFAVKVSKEWAVETTAFDIIDEMARLCGLTFSSDNSDIDNFQVYANTFTAENEYPVDVILRLLELSYGPDAFLCTNKDDEIIIKQRQRYPVSYDTTLTDSVVAEIVEEPEWPDFGNRIKITPAEEYATYYIDLQVEANCLNAGSTEAIKAWARVTDGEGLPVNDMTVDWLLRPAVGSLIYDQQKTITRTIIVSNEVVRADSFNTVQVKFPPDSVLGIWAYGDETRSVNFATGGVTIEGDYVYTSEQFQFCDQLLVISYAASGIAENTISLPS